LALRGIVCEGSSYIGVGVTADPRTDRIILVGDNTPASRAGLQHDDIVLNPAVWRDAHVEGTLLHVLVLREGGQRLVSVLVGKRAGGPAIVAVLVCMFLGGISGSGPADAAAVAMVMIPGMAAQGYPREFSASLIAAAGSTAILIPPSLAFIVYNILVPQASRWKPLAVTAGVDPGAVRRRHDPGHPRRAVAADPRPVLLDPRGLGTRRDARGGRPLAHVPRGGVGADRPGDHPRRPAPRPVHADGGGRRRRVLRLLRRLLHLPHARHAQGVSRAGRVGRDLIVLIIALASIFAHAGSTLGSFDAFAKLLLGFTASEAAMLTMIMVMLLIAGMLLDAISIFLVFLPILVPIMRTFHWDPVWFGVLMTMNLAIGQFTPPMAVNLMVTSRIAGVSIESTVRWVLWMVGAMLVALVMVAAMPGLATWLPRHLGY
jgi:TRAP-type C4-dicarboxylate transport system permease large subunit